MSAEWNRILLSLFIRCSNFALRTILMEKEMMLVLMYSFCRRVQDPMVIRGLAARGDSKGFRETAEMCLKLGKHFHELSIVQGKSVYEA